MQPSGAHCLSVCLSHHLSPHATAEGLLLRAQQPGDINQLLHGQWSAAAIPQHGEQQQMWAVPRCQLTEEAEHRFVILSFRHLNKRNKRAIEIHTLETLNKKPEILATEKQIFWHSVLIDVSFISHDNLSVLASCLQLHFRYLHFNVTALIMCVSSSMEDSCSSAPVPMWQACNTSVTVMKSVSVTAVANAVDHQMSVIDTAHIVCRSGSMKLSSVRLSVCPSIPSFGRRTLLWRVYCCAPGRQESSINYCTASTQQQMQAVSCCQLM